MAILEPFGNILDLKLAILERFGAHLGSTWRHLEAKGGIWEAYERHMEAKGRQKGAKWKNDYGEFERPGGMRGGLGNHS